AFIANSLYGTIWSLCLFPKGVKNENSATVVLKREHEHCGPNVIQVKYQITLLDKDGSVLEDKLIWENDFRRENSVFFYVCKRQEKVSDSEGKSFLPDDTLTVQCKIWKKDEEPIVSELLSARTVFKVQRRSFVWRIDKFSTLTPDLRSKFMVIDKLTDGAINFHLVINERLGSEKKLDIDIRSFDECINFISFQVSIVDSKGIKVNCGNQEDLDGNLKKGILFPLSFSMLMNEKSIYLPNGALCLDCEYAFSFVTSSTECARCGNVSSLVTEEAVQNKKAIKVVKEKSESTSVLVNDLKSMYNNAILCDMELRTSSKTFQAHKAILSARSSVFRRMFSSDMKEKNSGHVDITDLEEETVRRMLTYMYTDSLGDLQMESASKLYTAADKYNIPSLKHRCTSFLKGNLYPSTACDVLVLADMHQDHDLKSAVHDYIMNHDKEVFDTQEWKHFMATNLKLAADVMYQKVSQTKI
ncbi:Protein roadkill, partial [Araneus ventricosus]